MRLYKVFVPTQKYSVEDTQLSTLVAKNQNRTLYGGKGPLSVVKDYINAYDVVVEVKEVNVGEIIPNCGGRFIRLLKGGEILVIDLEGILWACTWDIASQKTTKRVAVKVMPI